MINILQDSVDFALKNNMFQHLQAIYQDVPSGECSGCTACCNESVNVSFIEFLNILVHKEDVLDNPRIQGKMLKYSLLELVKPMACPFLNDDKRCDIYAYRPLPCRLFGNSTKKTYQENYEEVKRQNLIFAKDIHRTHGLRLPKAVTHHKIDFCKTFQSTNPLSIVEIKGFYDRLIHMDSQFYFKGLSDDRFSARDVVGLFTAYFFEKEKPYFLSKDDIVRLRYDALERLNR